MSDIAVLEATLNDLLSRCSPARQRAALREIMQYAQTKNRERMAAQVNPDGVPFAPRKPQLRNKQGGIKRRIRSGVMFRKLRTMMQIQINDSGGTLDFRGNARIPEVHHFGLADRVRAGLTVTYTSRELLGLSDADTEAIRDIMIKHIAL